MTRTVVIAAIAVWLWMPGCGAHTTSTHEEPAPVASSDAVVLPADSPMLKQIHRQRVAVQDLPTDEVVAPGKIEANPNRVSKIVLPVTGRITSVLVKMGDAVKKDQP